MDKREIICIHIGQAGLQIASAVWELFRIEHEMTQTGEVLCFCPWPLKDNTKSLYMEYQNGTYKPRAILIDSEPLVIDDIKSGIGGKMFDLDRMVHGDDDAMSIFAKGYNSCAKKIVTKIETVIQGTIESSEMLNGYILFHSLGGGTGSGLTHKVTEIIEKISPKRPIFNLCITPSSLQSENLVEPYNTVLSTAALYETSNLVITMENNAIYRSMKSGFDNLVKQKLNFTDINRKVARISSCVTIPYRFNNKLSSDFGIYQTNLVPFKGLHFTLASYRDSGLDTDLNLYEITKECFENKHVTMNVDNELGSYFCSCCLFRGIGCSPSSINRALLNVKMHKNINFVDWAPTGFKVAISGQVPGVDPQFDKQDIVRSVCVLANHSAITQNWRILIDRFHQLLSRKVCLHWFLAEGIEEDALEYAKEKVSELIIQYEKLANYREKKPEPYKPLPAQHKITAKAVTNKKKAEEAENTKTEDKSEEVKQLSVTEASTQEPETDTQESKVSPQESKVSPQKSKVSPQEPKVSIEKPEDDAQKPEVTKQISDSDFLKSETDEKNGRAKAETESTETSGSSSSSTESTSGSKNQNHNAIINGENHNFRQPSYVESSSLVDLRSLTSQFSSITNISSQSSRYKSLSDALQNSFIQSTMSLSNYVQNIQIPKINSPEKAHNFLSKFYRIKSKLSIKNLNQCENQNHVNCLNISLNEIRNNTIFETDQFMFYGNKSNDDRKIDEQINELMLFKSLDFSICPTDMEFCSLTCIDLSNNSIIIPETCINSSLEFSIINGRINEENEPKSKHSKPFLLMKRGGIFILSKFRKIQIRSDKKALRTTKNYDDSIFKTILEDIIDENQMKSNKTVMDS